MLILLVAMSAFMSASEVALFSLSRFQLRTLKERSLVAHRKIKKLLADPSGLLVTILLVNELVNVALSAIMTRMTNQADLRLIDWLKSVAPFANVPEWALRSVVSTFLTLPIVLFFCEITPKATAVRINQILAPLVTGPLLWVYQIMRPVRFAVKIVVEFVSRVLQPKASGAQQPEATPMLREEEFLYMIEEGHKEGALHESEVGLIRNVFELDDRQVYEMLTPISEVQTVPIDMPLKDAIAVFRGHRYSRLPVTQGKRSVVGVLYSKDLLLARLDPAFESLTVSDLMRRAFSVPPTLRLNVLFKRLKLNRTHIAIVEKRPGDAIGIVTMSDILDELFEEFMDDDFDDDEAAV